MITRAKFRKATGFPPEQDDLERCNCDKAGKIGHFMCGWDDERDLPRFWPKVGQPLIVAHGLWRQE